MAPIPRPGKWVKKQFEEAVFSTINKFNRPTTSHGDSPRVDNPEPPYGRKIHPRWIYQLRENSTLINNSIEEKVSQTFRRGFSEWDKAYAAKCPNCKTEFHTLEKFREQLGQYGDQMEDDDVDLESPRICPECEELGEMHYPDDEDKEHGEGFFRQANEKTDIQSHLEPMQQNSVGQKFIDVCKELAWDIQSFDDAWMLFEREYTLDPERGVILDYDLKGVHRAPPEVMRYSINEKTGEFGNEYWVCPKCRAQQENYHPEKEPEDCSHCGGYTYEVYAVALDEPGGDPQNYYIRGEFAHASEYEPSKFYGYSPILTLWEEARTVEMMDDWYKTAYEERRAPRGAMLVRSSNAESVRAFNQGQMEKLRNDQHYIPTFIDDSDGAGKALEWVSLLEDPVEMQHMEMREWFLERISAKYGVTPAFQKGSPNNSGLSQSLEIVVSNRSADRLRQIFNDTFIPAFLGQLKVEGWERELRPVEEEEEAADADVQGKYVMNAKRAVDVGFDIEWTEDDKLKIHPGDPTEDVDYADGEFQPDSELPSGGQPGGGGGPEDGMPQPGGANQTGGAPGTPPHQEPRLQNSDASVTTGSSGYSNARYGATSGQEIDLVAHIEDMLEEQAKEVNKSAEDVTWDDIEISENIRIWIKDPEEAPGEAEVVHDPDEDVPADYYYEEEIWSAAAKAEQVNKTAEAIDFLWRPTLSSIVKQDQESDVDSEGTGEYEPYDPPESCERRYLEAQGIQEDDLPNGLQVFTGPEGKQFYCGNWKEVGAWEEGADEDFDPEGRAMDNVDVNDKIQEGQELEEYEGLFEFEGWRGVDEGQDIVFDLKDRDGWERFQFIDAKKGNAMLRDEEGEVAIAKADNAADRTQGVVGELTDEKYRERYQDYEVPREIYTADHVESKELIEDEEGEEGGVNSGYTRVVTFDNDEKAIYKNYRGSSHKWCLDGDAMAYELSDMIGMGDTFPETARTDLKNGFGSAQLFKENIQSFKDAVKDDDGFIDGDVYQADEIIVDNAEDFGNIATIDYMTGNRDRHDDNFMIDDTFNVYAIDNGGHPPPKDEAGDDAMFLMYKYIASHIQGASDSPDEFEDSLLEFFEGSRESALDNVESIVENKEEILTMAESFYGPTSKPTRRFRNMIEETEDGKLSIEESLETDIEQLEHEILNMNRDALP